MPLCSSAYIYFSGICPHYRIHDGRIVPLGGVLHFSPLLTYSKGHQAHASRVLVVLSLLILVSVLALGAGVCTARSEQSSAQLVKLFIFMHKGFACCVRGTLFAVISVHRLMVGVP